MKTLVYGFESYKEYKKNITKDIIRELNEEIEKTIFPVSFDKKVFTKEIRRVKPDFILGLGQHPRGEQIRIERKCFNHWEDKEEGALGVIEKGGPNHVFANVKIQKDNASWLSYDAGSYVCNFSMYVILTNFPDKKFAFLHIPKDYDVEKATDFIERKLDKFVKENN